MDTSDVGLNHFDEIFSNLDRFYLAYGYEYPTINELEDRVRVTFYFDFYTLPGLGIAHFIHDYIWDGGNWILIREEFSLDDPRLLLEVESN